MLQSLNTAKSQILIGADDRLWPPLQLQQLHGAFVSRLAAGCALADVACRDHCVQRGQYAVQSVKRDGVFFLPADVSDALISFLPQMTCRDLAGNTVVGVDPAQTVRKVGHTDHHIGK